MFFIALRLLCLSILTTISLYTHAAIETKIIGFHQVLNPSDSQVSLGSLDLQNVNPNLPVWLNLYYIGVKENDDRDTYNQIDLNITGVELTPNPYSIKLIADSLPYKQNFLLTEHEDVVDIVDDTLGQKIQDPIITGEFNPKKTRVYSTTMDLIQDINNHGNINISFNNQEIQGFKPIAVYAIAGQGDKPEILQQLTTYEVKLNGNGMPDKQWRKYGIIDPISGFMIFLVVAGALIYIKRKN